MDRLIRTAWRAFWVGLGASAVLITQSLLAPAPVTPGAAPQAPGADTTTPAIAAPASTPKSANPILSRNPFESGAHKKTVGSRS